MMILLKATCEPNHYDIAHQQNVARLLLIMIQFKVASERRYVGVAASMEPSSKDGTLNIGYVPKFKNFGPFTLVL